MAFNLDKMNLITKKLMLPVLFLSPVLAVAQTTTKNEEVNEESGTIKKQKFF